MNQAARSDKMLFSFKNCRRGDLSSFASITRAFLQAATDQSDSWEINQLQNEITKIANKTKFKGMMDDAPMLSRVTLSLWSNAEAKES